MLELFLQGVELVQQHAHPRLQELFVVRVLLTTAAPDQVSVLRLFLQQLFAEVLFQQVFWRFIGGSVV